MIYVCAVSAAVAAILGVLMAYPIGQGAVPSANGCNPCNGPGNWGPWGPWGPCQSNTYGQQVMKRTRQCTTTYCPNGEAQEQQSCGAQHDQPAQWGAWGPWSGCSATCGGGIMTRTRVCGCGVCQCQGSNMEEEACNTQPCVCTTCNPPAPPPQPCNTCYNPAPAPAPPLPAPAPSPCTNCNPVPSPCTTCGPQQPYYDPYSNGRKKRQLLLTQMKQNDTVAH